MLRIAEQQLDGRLFDDAAGIHHGDSIRHLCHHAEVMGDEEEREAETLLQISQQVEDLRLDGHVERGCRLIGDEEGRLARECEGNQRALPQAA